MNAPRQDDESLAPQVLVSSAAGAVVGFQLRLALATRRARRRRSRSMRGGRQPTHLRHPDRAREMGQGTLTGLRSSSPGSMRLEEGHHGFAGRPEPSRGSVWGDGDRRQPRHMDIGRLRSPRRRGGADDAAGRANEWNVPVGELPCPTNHHARRVEAYDRTARSPRPQQSAWDEKASSSRIRRTEDRRQALPRLIRAQLDGPSTRSTSVARHEMRGDQACPVFGGSSELRRDQDRRTAAHRARSGERRPSPSSPILGGVKSALGAADCLNEGPGASQTSAMIAGT